MSEYIVDGAEPNNTVLKSITANGYEHEKWLPVREEIVRCRDCKHCETVEGMFGGESLACGRFDDATVKPDGFCAWGKPREEGDTE